MHCALSKTAGLCSKSTSSGCSQTDSRCSGGAFRAKHKLRHNAPADGASWGRAEATWPDAPCAVVDQRVRSWLLLPAAAAAAALPVACTSLRTIRLLAKGSACMLVVTAKQAACCLSGSDSSLQLLLPAAAGAAFATLPVACTRSMNSALLRLKAAAAAMAVGFIQEAQRAEHSCCQVCRLHCT